MPKTNNSPRTRSSVQNNDNESIITQLRDTLQRVATLEEEVKCQQVTITKLESDVAICRKVNGLLSQDVEKTIEFHNFPENIPDKEVETRVMQLIEEAGVTVSKDDFHAVHRKKKRSVVIAKFISRKKKHEVIVSRKSLKGKNLRNGMDRVRIYESMSEYYAHMRFQLKKLWESKTIDSFWFFNGKLFYKFEESGDRVEVRHESDLRIVPEFADILFSL